MKLIGDVSRRDLVACLAGSAALRSMAAVVVPEAMERADDSPFAGWAFKRNGQFHREGNKPAVTIFHRDTGAVVLEGWYLDGKLHREDGPASILYTENGTPWQRGWYLSDVLQRVQTRA